MSADAPAPAPTSGDRKAAPAKVNRRDLVSFTHPDPVTGGEFDGIGVVLSVGGDGEPVVIRPLAPFDLYVDPANVSPVAADDVAPG